MNTLDIISYLMMIPHFIYFSIMELKGKSVFSLRNRKLNIIFKLLYTSIVLYFTIFYSFKLYYNSESYLNDRKMEIIENYDNGLVSVNNRFVPSDTYFDEVAIQKHDSITRVVFWADREKLSNNFFEFKWKVLSDYSFYLDPNDKLDVKILEYYFDNGLKLKM